MVYDMHTQLEIGQEGEVFLDHLFSATYMIHKPKTKAVDRIFRCRRTGKVLTVEYKTDWVAEKTGQAFIELVSVDKQNKPGWALSSPAHVLVYYVPGPMLIYTVRMERIKEQVAVWEQRYPTGTCQNRTYTSRGLLVPLEEMARVSSRIMRVRLETIRGDVYVDRVSPKSIEAS